MKLGNNVGNMGREQGMGKYKEEIAKRIRIGRTGSEKE